MESVFTQLFDRTAKKYSDRIAITWKDKNLTWRELDESVKRVAGGLQQLGIRKGDRVALILDNTPSFIISFLASIRLGAPVVPVNRSIQVVELRQIFSDCAVAAIICEPMHVAACRGVLKTIGGTAFLVVNDVEKDLQGDDVTFAGLLASDVSAEDLLCSAEDDLVVQYSSGSTGKSKRLSRSHQMCIDDACNHTATLAIDANDSIFCTAPLFHTYAMGNCFFASVGSGARLILFSEVTPFSLYRKQCLALMQKERPTILVTVPYICAQLADVTDDYNLSSIRIVTTAGTALPNEIFEKFLNRYGLALRQLYGCTEAGTVSVNMDEEIESSSGTVGRAIQGVSIKIVDENRQPVAAGTVGEIAISTSTMTTGYHGLSGVNHDVFSDGYFFTSDLGFLDNEDRLTLTGRKIKFIEVHGHKVNPEEVEEVLQGHPGVADAVVVGVSSSATGSGAEEQVKAVVVCNDLCKESDLIVWCRERLANFKVPSLVQFVDEIPRNPMGKVLRKLLV